VGGIIDFYYKLIADNCELKTNEKGGSGVKLSAYSYQLSAIKRLSLHFGISTGFPQLSTA
jgi:hypothetical protein